MTPTARAPERAAGPGGTPASAAPVARFAAVLVLFCAGLLAGCAVAPTAMEAYVPEHCNAATVKFGTFDIRQEEMPGFIEPVLRTALAGALERQGLTAVAPGGVADVTMAARFSLIDLNREPGTEGTRADTFGERLAPGQVTRFIAHVDLELEDNRDERLIWRGAMDRRHTILGGETFHDDRAILIVSTTLDQMLEGIVTPCGG